MSRAAPLRIPELGEACPRWVERGYREWASPLRPEDERSRSLGAEKVYERERGYEKSGRVVGSGSPAVPSAGDLLRRGESLCAPSTLIATPLGAVVAVQSTRVRELNRTPRPIDEGLRIPVLAARAAVAEMRAALELGDVFASDDARGGTLPYPHREGSSPCSGSRRPAAVLRDVLDWSAGEGHDNWSRADALRRARELGPGVKRLRDVSRVALEVETSCVATWDAWVERGLMGRREQMREARAAVRASYASTRKRGALARTSRYTVG